MAGHVLSTKHAREVRPADGVLERVAEAAPLRLEHWLCLPREPRPIRLARVSLTSRAAELLEVDYTEIWDIAYSTSRSEPGAALATTPMGERALADVGRAILAKPPRHSSQSGLALDLRLWLPPDKTRRLWFAYVAPGPDEPAASLVRAWRGGVERELDRRLAPA